MRSQGNPAPNRRRRPLPEGAGAVARRRIVGYLSVLMLAGILAFAPAAAAAVRDDASYRGDIAAAHDLVAGPSGLDAREAREIAGKLDELVPADAEVRLPSGEVVRVDNSVARGLIARFEAATTATERKEVREELRAHLTSMRLALGEPGAGVPEDREAFERILGEQPADAPSPLAEFFGEFVERLAELLEKWWTGIGVSSTASAWITTLTRVLIAALALLVLLLAVRALLRARSSRACRGRPVPLPAYREDAVPAARDLPDDPLAYADACARRGEMREAVRALFGGAARELQRAGYLRETARRTDSELLADVLSRSREAATPLRALCTLFERAWYGHRDPATDEYARAREHFSAILGAIASTGGESA